MINKTKDYIERSIDDLCKTLIDEYLEEPIIDFWDKKNQMPIPQEPGESCVKKSQC